MTKRAPPNNKNNKQNESRNHKKLPGELSTRLAAVEILHAVLHKNKMLDYALDDSPAFANLDERDKRLARMIVSTTLRRLGQINTLIIHALTQDKPPRPARLHVLLQTSIAQIVFLNIPAYAAVDTAVSLAPVLGLKKQKGLINAVLRRLSREAPDIIAKQNAGALNIPPWLLKIWGDDYGAETAHDIALASLSEAPLDLTIKNPANQQSWADLLGGTLMPTGTVRLTDGGFVPALQGFQTGDWWVQDCAAAIPVKLFGEISGKTAFDLCAAPGGKTAQLAAGGAQVKAIDRSANRLAVLEKNIARLGLEKNVDVITADSNVWDPGEQADMILLDAPCSATGTIRRHPDLLYLKSPRDIERLTHVQDKLLSHATSLLKPGGTLIYCTCSLQKAEGEQRIERFLDHNTTMRRAPIKSSEVGGLSQILTDAGDVRCLPFHQAALGGMDGFYAARLVKKG